jgi:hypothetical protein
MRYGRTGFPDCQEMAIGFKCTIKPTVVTCPSECKAMHCCERPTDCNANDDRKECRECKDECP